MQYIALLLHVCQPDKESNFIIRKFQQIIPKTLIVILYSKITTLVNQRNRIISFYTILGEHGSWGFDAIKQNAKVIF